jgi:signal transduction histidine kinase/ActR/RegA family two-component response regulator
VSRKITALVLLSTLAALTVSAVALLWYSASDYREARLADVRTQAEVVGRAAAPALAFNDPNDAEHDLATLAARPDILRAALYDADGKIFAFYATEGDITPIPDRLDERALGTHGERLTLAYPIIEDGQRLGTLVIDATYGQRARQLAYLAILGGVTLGSLLASFLVSSWLQRAVTKPILGVADAARGVIERRDLSVRAGKTTDDEIGILADAMNRMLADLEREMAERRAAEEALITADRRKDEFLATLAHELRNPLAPIRNALYLMRMENADGPTLVEARAIIERQVQQMVRLVDDLLEVSRITTGKLRLKRERVELRKVAAAALEAVEPVIREKGHRLTVALPPHGLTIEADPTRLAQVFLNLLNNAAKFTEPGGSIDFLLEVRDGEMVARVRDDGVGIAPDMIEPIFEMFAQADRSLERTAMGLGVGLSLSRRLMELHGGTIEARSDGANRGSEFVVRMPAAGAEMPIHSIETAARVPDADENGRPGILVVDDNEDFASSLGRMLRARGYDVRVEHDGLAGLAAAESFRPAVAFLDIGMPKLNGYDLARRMRALPATSRAVLIAVTGWGQDEDRSRTQQAGFDGHLVKPIDPPALLSLLAALAENGKKSGTPPRV